MTGTFKIFRFIISAFILLATLSLSADVCAVEYPAKPTGDVFVIDAANIISEADEQIINATSLNLRNENSIPIVVVTIESLFDYEATDLSIEAYSRALFDEWEIGLDGYNYGMLLLVSKADRKARIELGADWAGAGNEGANYIMDKIIIRSFKFNKYSEGIREGVSAMDSLARGAQLPSPYLPKWAAIAIYSSGTLFILFLLLTGISFIKSGKKGWGWVVLAAAAAIFMFLLNMFLASAKGGFSDGGFSGGGSSGGGGATGSW